MRRTRQQKLLGCKSGGKVTLKVIFTIFTVLVFVFGTFTLITVKNFASKLKTPDPFPGKNWAEVCCGTTCPYDYCAGVGKWKCCLPEK